MIDLTLSSDDEEDQAPLGQAPPGGGSAAGRSGPNATAMSWPPPIDDEDDAHQPSKVHDETLNS